VGFSAGPAIQCPGLTGIGHHRADKPTDQRPRESHARRLSPTKDSRLPRPRFPSRPTPRRRFPLGIAVLAVVHASHYPLQRRSRGTSTDVQGRLQESLQENSGTTHRALTTAIAEPPRAVQQPTRQAMEYMKMVFMLRLHVRPGPESGKHDCRTICPGCPIRPTCSRRTERA
jgi:hypothetical protein